MSDRYSIAEARAGLPKLVRDAEAGKAVELTRRGEAVAVLVGRKDYERLTSKRTLFSDAYSAFVGKNDLRELEIDPGEVFGAVRDREGGREVPL
jgi:prevent-host-death family protein